MGTSSTSARRRISVTFAAVFGCLVAASPGQALAQGKTPIAPLSELRIEGPRSNLDPGTWYTTPRERIRRSRGNACRHRRGTIALDPSALSIAESAAAASSALPPVRVRPDDFGLFVCEIGGVVGRPFDDPAGFSGWTYWLDFAGGTQAAENELLSGGERVLWIFSDFGAANRNTGGALELSGVPPYDADGTFVVQVVEHAYDGLASPLAGAQIKGAESVDDLGGGSYEVTVASGRTTLFAQHRPDIASNRIKVCVGPSAAQCPVEHGRRIVGSRRAEGILGTDGWDNIRSRGGDDQVLIHQGGRDRVDCGAGDDLVRLAPGDGDDRIAANCEEVEEAT